MAGVEGVSANNFKAQLLERLKNIGVPEQLSQGIINNVPEAQLRKFADQFEQIAGTAQVQSGAATPQTPGQNAYASPPSQAYGQSKNAAGGYQNGALTYGGTPDSGMAALERMLENPKTKARAEKIIAEHNLTRDDNGNWRQQPKDPNAMPATAQIAGAAPMTGVAAGMTAGTGLGATMLPGVGTMANFGNGVAGKMTQYLGRMSGSGAGRAVLGAGVVGAGLLGGGSVFQGIQHQLRKNMFNMAQNMKDSAMMNMLQNPAIPIEDLIFMFMAHMSENYEEKLRMKMQEANLAERMERNREVRRDNARAMGGLASLVPVVGPLVGSAMEVAASQQDRIEGALSGGSKSSVMLANEVQMLMHKWKQLNELTSNLLKTMHDMAMTPARNIR